MKLREALADCPPVLLMEIARRHGVVLSEASLRAEILGAIEGRLGDRPYLRDYLDALSPVDSKVLQVVVGAGGTLKGYELERRLRQQGALGDSRTARQAVADLQERGMLFRSFVSVGPRRGEVYHVPDEVLDLVPAQPTEPALADLVERAQPTGPLHTCDPVFDLFLIARSLRQTRGQRLGQLYRDLAELQSEPDAQDEIANPKSEIRNSKSDARWRFLVAVGIAAGMLERSGGRVLPADDLADLLADRPGAARRLFEAYLRCDDWDELAESKLATSPLLGRVRDLAEIRERLVDVAASLESSGYTRNPEPESRTSRRGWLILESLSAALQQVDPDLVREHYESPTAGLLDPRTGQLLRGPASWDLVERPLLRHVLLGPLYWLGVVGWSRDSRGREVLALTSQGAALCSGQLLALLPPVSPARLERDGTLAFPADGSLAAMYRLEPYVRLEPGTQNAELTYVLDQSSLCAGLADGGSLDEALDALSDVLRAPLGERVRERLENWASAFGQVSVHPAVLLALGERPAARRVLDEPTIAPLLRQRLGDDAAEVSWSNVAPLVRALRDLGHYPEVDATLRLMAGRGAYAALVDEHVLELLFVSLEALKRLAPSALADLEHADELGARLQSALGRERTRRLRTQARRIVREAGKR